MFKKVQNEPLLGRSSTIIRPQQQAVGTGNPAEKGVWIQHVIVISTVGTRFKNEDGSLLISNI